MNNYAVEADGMPKPQPKKTVFLTATEKFPKRGSTVNFGISRISKFKFDTFGKSGFSVITTAKNVLRWLFKLELDAFKVSM